MSRFDPFNDEIWGCFCDLCMALAGAVVRGGNHWEAPSEALYQALMAGSHKKRGPKVSLSKVKCYRPKDSFMQTGIGLGVTPGGVSGSVRGR